MVMADTTQHPLADKWAQPEGSKASLQIYNTFTRTKVPFIPKDGNSVRWYNCGPTVYDASHIGHARNYVTFDILRRIMEDYFGFNVTLIMNITDIDDKIILRARQAYLVKKYREEHPLMTAELKDELQLSWNEYLNSKFKGLSWAEVQAKMGGEDEKDAKEVMYFKNLSNSLSLMNSSSAESLNALFASFEDILSPYLDSKYGASVTDQKIFRDLAEFWEIEFLKDMDSLNVRPVSIMTRVTEFVPQIVEFVQKIIENGYGYEAEGSVYFNVAKFASAKCAGEDNINHIYAKLCPWSAGNCKFFEEGEGSLGMKLAGKRDPRDFALWKASKAGEPFWPSPWGSGRPGWHIECSAMAAAVSPGTLDIHSGGIDLAFPHHDNELAQSEAFYGCSQWVNYFMHAGHVHIEGHKMSKSLKNFITIREALARYSSRQLRIMFLQHLWCAPVYYKESSMTTAVAVETLFTNFIQNCQAVIRAASAPGVAPPCFFGTEESDLVASLSKCQNALHAALCDNFDTPLALNLLQELIGRTNVYLQRTNLNIYVIKMVYQFVSKIMKVFGLLDEDSEKVGQGALWEKVGPILEAASEFRDSIRAAVRDDIQSDGNMNKEILELCDKFRESVATHGVLFEDRPGKSTLVKIVSANDIAKMKAEQEEKAAQKLARKLEMAKINEAKAAAKLAKGSIEPANMFKSDSAYSKWDEKGIPTHDAAGVELGKNALKKLTKEYEAQVELHEKFLAGKL